MDPLTILPQTSSPNPLSRGGPLGRAYGPHKGLRGEGRFVSGGFETRHYKARHRTESAKSTSNWRITI